MAERKQCEFQLIRYVPDPVKNEFVNIGVLLFASDGGQSGLRFTRNWGRVHCLDPDADTQMLEALETEVGHHLRSQPPDHPRPIRAVLESSFSNGVQITESKAYLAESFVSGLEELMRLYVDPPKRERKHRLGGRAAIKAVMRKRFEDAGILKRIRENIPVAPYTRPGDPLRIDFIYTNGMVKMFQAISLDSGVDEAKLLCFAAPALFKGVREREQKELLLTAITEPLDWPEGDGLPDAELTDRSEYVEQLLQLHSIRRMTTSDLPQIVATAREDLKV